METAQKEIRFAAPWGFRLAVTTGLSLLLFAGGALALLVVGFGLDWRGFLVTTALAVAVVVSLQITARAYLIRGYVVSGDGANGNLIVERLGTNIRIDLADLQSLEIDPKAMSWTYLMPNGGLFSLGGQRCRNLQLGLYEAYATDPSRSVVLRFVDRVVVVTPEDPEGFVQAIEAARGAQLTAV